MIKFTKQMEANYITTQVAKYLSNQGYHFEIRGGEIVTVFDGDLICHFESRPSYNIDDPVYLLVRDTLRYHVWKCYRDENPDSMHSVEVKYVNDNKVRLRLYRSRGFCQSDLVIKVDASLDDASLDDLTSAVNAIVGGCNDPTNI